ncbi:MAG: hypothetical protein ACREIA_00965 [Opitutaceae bacterium]
MNTRCSCGFERDLFFLVLFVSLYAIHLREAGGCSISTVRRRQVEKEQPDDRVEREQLHALEPVALAVARDLGGDIDGEADRGDLRQRELEVEPVRKEGFNQECLWAAAVMNYTEETKGAKIGIALRHDTSTCVTYG